ncbi:hypothetical protein SDC9_36086 [bioreactor metagenome]|uniref:Uncharacterized protein n=1 Tax=bioreactor metagenome TaxID=1076179 RepID=A0A644VFI8_9ZZZZ
MAPVNMAPVNMVRPRRRKGRSSGPHCLWHWGRGSGQTRAGFIRSADGGRRLALHPLDVAIALRGMAFGQPRPVAEELLAQRALAVAGGIDAALLQLGHDMADDIGEGLVRQRIGEVEAVDAGLLDPVLQQVGDRLARADEERPHAADAAPFRQLLDRPDLVAAGQMLNRRDDRIGLHLLHRVGRRIGAEVDAGPARHQHKRPVIGGMALIFLVFRPRLRVGLGGDDRRHRVDQHLLRVAPGGGGAGADLAHIGLGRRFQRRRDEHAFGVLGGEGLARARGAGLEQHRGALRRGFAQVIARHVEIAALVADLVDLRGVCEQAAAAVAQHGAILPAALQQLVEHLEIFGGDVIAVVVAAQPALTDVLRPAFEIGGDDVPADPPLGVVVGRAEPAREGIGMLERGRGGDADAQMPRRLGDRVGKLQRVVHRNLHALAQRLVETALVDIVIADHVGQEDRVEKARLQQPCEVGPVVEILVLPRAVARVAPQPGRLVPDAVHLEGVEADLLAHCPDGSRLGWAQPSAPARAGGEGAGGADRVVAPAGAEKARPFWS